MIYTNETNTNLAFKSQIKISWHKILCDVLTEELIAIQQSYFTNIESKKGVHVWATNLITNPWNILHQLWFNINEVLHQTKQILILSGLFSLKEDIRKEHTTERSTLPRSYSKYFHNPLPPLFNKVCNLSQKMVHCNQIS